MTDVASTARTAREGLAQGLAALQAPGVPPELMNVAEPIAAAMGALHRVESGQGQPATEANTALESVRRALSMLQASSGAHAAVDRAMEAVASSLGQVHSLTQMATGAPPQHAPPQHAQPQHAQPQQHAAPQPNPAHAPTAAAPAAHYAQPPAPQQAPPQQAQPQYGQPPAPQPNPAHAPTAAAPAQHYAPPPGQYGPPPGQQAAPQQPAPQQAAPMPAPQQAAPAQAVGLAGTHVMQPGQAPQQQPPQQQPAPQQPQPQWGQPPQQQQPGGGAAAAAAHAAAAAGVPPGWAPQQGQPPPGPAQAQPPAGAAPHQPAAQPAKPMSIPPEEMPKSADGLPFVEAALGAHSPTNFYKGLAGNDVVDDGGIFIATYQIPPIGTKIHIKLAMPGGYEFDAKGVVKWTRESGSGDAPPGYGAGFTEITSEGRQLVYRYVRNREPVFYDDL